MSRMHLCFAPPNSSRGDLEIWSSTTSESIGGNLQAHHVDKSLPHERVSAIYQPKAEQEIERAIDLGIDRAFLEKAIEDLKKRR